MRSQPVALEGIVDDAAPQPELLVTDKQLRKLIARWTADRDGFQAEVRRLELSDLLRNQTSIAMLEARVQAIDHCILQIGTLDRF